MRTMITVSESTDGILEIRATGGTRRQRGATIAAVIRTRRKGGDAITRVSVSYSETYGFLSATYARYRIVNA